MWYLTLIPILFIGHDYMKAPIDNLYFNNWRRPFIGMRNTLIDVLMHSPEYSVWQFKGLHLIQKHYRDIRKEFEDVSKTLDKTMYHNLDVWFDKNDNYYQYRFNNFPKLKSLIKQIPCILEETASFAVMEGPVTIPPHRAETNALLRYHLTIMGDGDCTLYTENGPRVHTEGEAFIFDHSRYHEVTKTGPGKRVVLILDIKRF
jgi:aspartyl/asparaginyl beta-hydroxylase (cupin superfamily)